MADEKTPKERPDLNRSKSGRSSTGGGESFKDATKRIGREAYDGIRNPNTLGGLIGENQILHDPKAEDGGTRWVDKGIKNRAEVAARVAKESKSAFGEGASAAAAASGGGATPGTGAPGTGAPKPNTGQIKDSLKSLDPSLKSNQKSPVSGREGKLPDGTKKTKSDTAKGAHSSDKTKQGEGSKKTDPGSTKSDDGDGKKSGEQKNKSRQDKSKTGDTAELGSSQSSRYAPGGTAPSRKGQFADATPVARVGAAAAGGAAVGGAAGAAIGAGAEVAKQNIGHAKRIGRQASDVAKNEGLKEGARELRMRSFGGSREAADEAAARLKEDKKKSFLDKRGALARGSDRIQKATGKSAADHMPVAGLKAAGKIAVEGEARVVKGGRIAAVSLGTIGLLVLFMAMQMIIGVTGATSAVAASTLIENYDTDCGVGVLDTSSLDSGPSAGLGGGASTDLDNGASASLGGGGSAILPESPIDTSQVTNTDIHYLDAAGNDRGLAFTEAQIKNAGLIIGAGQAMDVPAQAIVIALATALQESDMKNPANDGSYVPDKSPELWTPKGGKQADIPTWDEWIKWRDIAATSMGMPHYNVESDWDSVGILQMRESMGYGTVAQLMNPSYQATEFYKRLLKVPGWESMSVAQAAQKVQISDFPDAYAKHEATARMLASKVEGIAPDGASMGIMPGVSQNCGTQSVIDSCVPTTDALEKGLTNDAILVARCTKGTFGESGKYSGLGGVSERPLNPNSDHPSGRAIDIMIPDYRGSGKAGGDEIAQWLIDNADALGVKYVIWYEQIWTKDSPTWKPYKHPSGATDDTNLHYDHIHVSVYGQAGTGMSTSEGVGGNTAPTGSATPMRPVEGYRVTSRFGPRGGGKHAGTDLAIACRTPFYSILDGVVLNPNGLSGGRTGNQMMVDHGGGIWSRYGHYFSGTSVVQYGQQVAQGQNLAQVGGSKTLDPYGAGNSTGCHIHFEIIERGHAIDAQKWFAARGVSL